MSGRVSPLNTFVGTATSGNTFLLAVVKISCICIGILVLLDSSLYFGVYFLFKLSDEALHVTQGHAFVVQGLVYSLLEQKEDADRAFMKYRRRRPQTFGERGYLDDLMIGAKTEARKIDLEERHKQKEKIEAGKSQEEIIKTYEAARY